MRGRKHACITSAFVQRMIEEKRNLFLISDKPSCHQDSRWKESKEERLTRENQLLKIPTNLTDENLTSSSGDALRLVLISIALSTVKVLHKLRSTETHTRMEIRLSTLEVVLNEVTEGLHAVNCLLTSL